MAEAGSILLVEDDKINASLIAKRLEQRGYQVDLAHTGNECIEKIKTNKYDLLLLDFLLPDVTGTEVLHHVRQYFSAFELPIIISTAKNDSSCLVSCLKDGANDYIQKPINIDIAEARINLHLNTSRGHGGDQVRKHLDEMCLHINKHSKDLGELMAHSLGTIQLIKEEKDIEKLSDIEDSLNKVSTLLNKLTELSLKK